MGITPTDQGCPSDGPVTIMDTSGPRRTTQARGTPLGWVDASHVIVSGQQPCGPSSPCPENAPLYMLDVDSLQTTPTVATGYVAGHLPGAPAT